MRSWQPRPEFHRGLTLVGFGARISTHRQGAGLMRRLHGLSGHRRPPSLYSGRAHLTFTGAGASRPRVYSECALLLELPGPPIPSRHQSRPRTDASLSCVWSAHQAVQGRLALALDTPGRSCTCVLPLGEARSSAELRELAECLRPVLPWLCSALRVRHRTFSASKAGRIRRIGHLWP